jgi:hypothetical protein
MAKYYYIDYKFYATKSNIPAKTTNGIWVSYSTTGDESLDKLTEDEFQLLRKESLNLFAAHFRKDPKEIASIVRFDCSPICILQSDNTLNGIRVSYSAAIADASMIIHIRTISPTPNRGYVSNGFAFNGDK